MSDPTVPPVPQKIDKNLLLSTGEAYSAVMHSKHITSPETYGHFNATLRKIHAAADSIRGAVRSGISTSDLHWKMERILKFDAAFFNSSFEPEPTDETVRNRADTVAKGLHVERGLAEIAADAEKVADGMRPIMVKVAGKAERRSEKLATGGLMDKLSSLSMRNLGAFEKNLRMAGNDPIEKIAALGFAVRDSKSLRKSFAGIFKNDPEGGKAVEELDRGVAEATAVARAEQQKDRKVNLREDQPAPEKQRSSLGASGQAVPPVGAGSPREEHPGVTSTTSSHEQEAPVPHAEPPAGPGKSEPRNKELRFTEAFDPPQKMTLPREKGNLGKLKTPLVRHPSFLNSSTANLGKLPTKPGPGQQRSTSVTHKPRRPEHGSGGSTF
ncbi:hypothetical protein [Kitasatospora sp. GAS204B]|uniref:hypothetical protein n=1 Tax=unclassified Kitasatospora TaxID=2633591 RepID=UPI0024735E56|nr:hypothetical protein [Kitasatospora sp. GAS204B]MDH6119805.1 hypothetical protein [Kitasatospora sp. GAS204B]